MNITTHQMDPRIAAIHYKDYRKKVREHRTERMEEARKKVLAAGRDLRSARSYKSLLEKEDEVLMESYREMARGQRILNLGQVMREAGIAKEGKRLPLLAVAQADWAHVIVQRERGHVIFHKDRWVPWDHNRGRFLSGAIGVPDVMFPPELTNENWRGQNSLPRLSQEQFKALVPAIPAMLRPKGELSSYHILWEARWGHMAPPDPLLLKHISGLIYTVLAQWDLTPLEKMVLEGRSAS
jgi:hypothetical protein